MIQSLDKLCNRIAYQYTDLELLKEALTHRSAAKRNNERMEFLGDSILNFIIADELYRRYPDANEGELSRLRATLVKGDKLAVLATDLEVVNSRVEVFAGPLFWQMPWRPYLVRYIWTAGLQNVAR